MNKVSSNNKHIGLYIVAAILCVTIAILLIVVMTDNKTTQPTGNNTVTEPADNNEVASKLPQHLVELNECRILKMVDQYNEIKTDRTKREAFNIYSVIDGNTDACVEERSANPDFSTSISQSWESRKDVKFSNSMNMETPQLVLDELNDRFNFKLEVSEDRDAKLKYVAQYYAYWGMLGETNPTLHNLRAYQCGDDLIYEAGATYVTTNEGFTLTITLPYSGEKIVVNQNSSKDTPTPNCYTNWPEEWWNKDEVLLRNVNK